MKISELIKSLEEMKELAGDMDVYTNTTDVSADLPWCTFDRISGPHLMYLQKAEGFFTKDILLDGSFWSETELHEDFDRAVLVLGE